MSNIVIPPALNALVNDPTFIGWKKLAQMRTAKDGTVLNSWTKCPCNWSGRAIKSNEPDNLRNAHFFIEGLGKPPYGFEGLAIANIGNTRGDRLIIDLDDCRDPELGVIAEWARDIIERCNSYTEISPSGSGIHIIGGSEGWDKSKPNGRHIWTGPERNKLGFKETGEVFFQTGFVTISFDPLPGYESRWSEIGHIAEKLPRRKGRGDVDTAFDDGQPIDRTKPRDPLAPAEVIRETLRRIPNDDSVQSNWRDWDIIGMAIWCATEGSEDGLALWTEWSVQHPTYGLKHSCDERWSKWRMSSPPTDTGYGKIHYEAKKSMWINGFVWDGDDKWNDWNEQRKRQRHPDMLPGINGLLEIEVTLDNEIVARSSEPNPFTGLTALPSTGFGGPALIPYNPPPTAVITTSLPSVNDNAAVAVTADSSAPWLPPILASGDDDIGSVVPATVTGGNLAVAMPSGGAVSRLPPNVATAIDALHTREELKGLYGYDQMARCEVMMRPFPGTRPNVMFPRPQEDRDVVDLQDYLQRLGLVKITKDACRDAIERVAHENEFHPLRNYLDSLVWDGVHRVGIGDAAGGWMARYLGVAPNEYSMHTGQMFMISLIARAYRPGCKVDYVPVWFGQQGIKKSSACRILIGDEWFSDNLPHDIGNKDTKQHVRGKWLVEVAELSAFKPADVEKLKDFITRRDEMYRPPFGRKEVKEPRTCVFIATTNDQLPFKDPTGNRRFWPATIGKIDLEGLTRDRDMIMAEAVQMFQMGMTWWPETEFERDLIKPVQEEHYDVDVLEDPIATHLRLKQQAATVMDVVKMVQGGGIVDWTKVGRREQWRISGILTHLGWEMRRSGPNGERYWYPKDMARWERAPGTFNMMPWVVKGGAPDMSNVTILQPLTANQVAGD